MIIYLFPFDIYVTMNASLKEPSVTQSALQYKLITNNKL